MQSRPWIRWKVRDYQNVRVALGRGGGIAHLMSVVNVRFGSIAGVEGVAPEKPSCFVFGRCVSASTMARCFAPPLERANRTHRIFDCGLK